MARSCRKSVRTRSDVLANLVRDAARGSSGSMRRMARCRRARKRSTSSEKTRALVLEVEVEGAAGDAGGFDDVLDLGGVVAALGENVACAGKDLGSALGLIHRGRGVTETTGSRLGVRVQCR